MIGFIGLALMFVLYFLPTIIGRNKRNCTAILVTNFFFGWTVIGWFVALIWATCKDSK